MPHDARHERDFQRARRHVLFGQKDARRHVAARENDLLQSLREHVESGLADTLAFVVVEPFAHECEWVKR